MAIEDPKSQGNVTVVSSPKPAATDKPMPDAPSKPAPPKPTPRPPSKPQTDPEPFIKTSEIVHPIIVKPAVEPPPLPSMAARVRPLAFKNPTNRDIHLQTGDGHVKMPPGTASWFPGEPNAPDRDAQVGSHRAIHRQAPDLICEFGPDCPVRNT